MSGSLEEKTQLIRIEEKTQLIRIGVQRSVGLLILEGSKQLRRVMSSTPSFSPIFQFRQSNSLDPSPLKGIRGCTRKLWWHPYWQKGRAPRHNWPRGHLLKWFPRSMFEFSSRAVRASRHYRTSKSLMRSVPRSNLDPYSGAGSPPRHNWPSRHRSRLCSICYVISHKYYNLEMSRC